MLFPALSNEILNLAKEKADDAAIQVFAKNLKQLLLAKKELTDKAAKEFSNSTKAEEVARRASFGNEAKSIAFQRGSNQGAIDFD
ncbi:MAG: hypothetical protein B7Z07_01650 [Sphingomonadales bacterium 32-67-7]|nr:MAG: hypothetical protein B7Z07_01650 [Sphingomonadales bacterium 32-67-7]